MQDADNRPYLTGHDGAKYAIRLPDKVIHRLCDIEAYEDECLLSSTDEFASTRSCLRSDAISIPKPVIEPISVASGYLFSHLFEDSVQNCPEAAGFNRHRHRQLGAGAGDWGVI